MNMKTFPGMVLGSNVEVDLRLRYTYYLHHQGDNLHTVMPVSTETSHWLMELKNIPYMDLLVAEYVIHETAAQ